MATAKLVRLGVRPTQSADLCYPISGIIDYQPENLLGLSTDAFNLRGLQDSLLPAASLPAPGNFAANPITNDSAQLVVPRVGDGPAEIDGAAGASALSRLRAKDIANQLTQALAWYGMKDSVDQTSTAINKRIALLGNSPTDPNSLFALLDRLSDTLKTRHDKLASLYEQHGVSAVTNATATSEHSSETTGGQAFTTKGKTDTFSSIDEFQVPPADNAIRYLRAEIALRQESLAAYRLVKMNSRDNLQYAKAITAAEIRKIQLGYVETFLLPPFAGVVTAVFRGVGEFVTAGEPVLRLENDKTVFLVGQIKCRSLIRVGYVAQVTTTLFGASTGTAASVSGTVCAVRGHEPIDEQWDVIVRCNNETATGERILPLNYNFDYDSTSIEIDES